MQNIKEIETGVLFFVVAVIVIFGVALVSLDADITGYVGVEQEINNNQSIVEDSIFSNVTLESSFKLSVKLAMPWIDFLD